MCSPSSDPAEHGYVGLRMTAAEFFALGETRERLQLVDGVVVLSPRPAIVHQKILALVLRQLQTYLDDHPGGECFPEVDWELRPNTVYSPDIVCYVPGRLSAIAERLTKAPDLVIEILSPGTMTFDLTTKKDDYERCGVAEYWTIDSANARPRCYRHRAGRFVEITFAGDALASSALAGFTLEISPLRAALEPGRQ